MKLKIIELTYRDVEKLISDGYRNLIIPVGTIEAHGPHLPLGTDALIPEIIAESIASDIKALIAPTLYYGLTSSLLRYTGTSTLSQETLVNQLKEVILSYKQHGFEKFVIMNGHGGNIDAIRKALNDLWLEHRIKSIAIHWWIFAREVTLRVFGEPGAHAGVDETAFILHRYPELVREEYYTDNESFLKENGLDIWPSPGSIIIYERNRGLPRFDKDLADKYVGEVINLIRNRLIELLSKI